MAHSRQNRAGGLSVREAVLELDPAWASYFTDGWIRANRGSARGSWSDHAVCVLLDCHDPVFAIAWSVMEIGVSQSVRDRVYRGCAELNASPVHYGTDVDVVIRALQAQFD